MSGIPQRSTAWFEQRNGNIGANNLRNMFGLIANDGGYNRIQKVKEIREWSDLIFLIGIISGRNHTNEPQFKTIKKNYGFTNIGAKNSMILFRMYAIILEIPMENIKIAGYRLPNIKTWQPAINLKEACKDGVIQQYIERQYRHKSREVQTAVGNMFPNVVAEIIAKYTIPVEYDAFIDSGIQIENDNNDIHTIPSNDIPISNDFDGFSIIT